MKMDFTSRFGVDLENMIHLRLLWAELKAPIFRERTTSTVFVRNIIQTPSS